MKFIHASDFHLCKSFHDSSLPVAIAKGQRERLFRAFFDIIHICKEEKVDILLLSGDLFESNYAKVSDFKRVSDAFALIPSTHVFIACGNHDPYRHDSYYNLIQFPPNVKIFPSTYTRYEIKELNTVVHGFSWDKYYYEQAPFQFEPVEKNRINLLCLHADALTKSKYFPINADALDRIGFDYVALGHIHKQMQVKNKIFYAGSPEPLDFTEKGKHGYLAGEILPNRKMLLKAVNNARTEFVNREIRLDAGMDTNDIAGKITQDCMDKKDSAIIRLVLTGSVNPLIDVDKLMEEIKDSFYCLLYVNKSVCDYDIQKLYSENQNNIIGKYIKSLMYDAAKDETSYRALMAGLNALLQQPKGGR